MALYIVLKVFRQIWSAYFFQFRSWIYKVLSHPMISQSNWENENELELEIKNYKTEKKLKMKI